MKTQVLNADSFTSFKKKMPKLNVPSTLRDVCYNSVVAHMDDYWSLDYLSKYDHKVYPLHILGPFDNTAPKFLEKILEGLLFQNKLRSHHLDLLLMSTVKTLCLTKWNGIHTFLSKTHNGIKLRNLTYLDLSMCIIRKKMFYTLSENIPSIETLILKATKCDDKVLSILGSNSPNIQILDLENCLRVTDIGIYSLMLNDLEQVQPGCLKIRELNLSFTGITSKGAACALINLPHLVKFNNQNSLEALEYALKSSQTGQQFFHLENLVVTSELMSHAGNMTDISITQLQMAVKHLPYISSVTLYQVRICPEDLQSELINLTLLAKELAKFEHLNELCIYGNPHDSGYTFLQVYDFLKIRGTDLTHLHFGELNFSVDLVGLYCPNLVSLKLETILQYESVNLTQKTPLPYSKLQTLYIDCNSNTSSYDFLNSFSNCSIKQSDLLTLLGNCLALKKLALLSLNNLTDKLLDIILLSNPLLKLECLEIVNNMFITDISIAKFIENSENSLKKIIYTNCKRTNNESYENFVRFCQEKNFDIEIIWK